MPQTQTIQVEIHGNTKQLQDELRELEVRAKVVSTRPGSKARMRALEEQSRYYTERAAESARAYSELCRWWDLRGYLARVRARRYDRELARP